MLLLKQVSFWDVLARVSQNMDNHHSAPLSTCKAATLLGNGVEYPSLENLSITRCTDLASEQGERPDDLLRSPPALHFFDTLYLKDIKTDTEVTTLNTTH